MQEEGSQKHQILELKGPGDALSFQAVLMGDNHEAAFAVIRVECRGFSGAASFQFEATRLATFVRGLDGLRRGGDQPAVFELPQYPDCNIVVGRTREPELAFARGVIGSVVGSAPDRAYRLAVRFGFHFERGQLDQLTNLFWARARDEST